MRDLDVVSIWRLKLGNGMERCSKELGGTNHSVLVHNPLASHTKHCTTHIGGVTLNKKSIRAAHAEQTQILRRCPISLTACPCQVGVCAGAEGTMAQMGESISTNYPERT
jgi:hypothetical protein